MNWPVSDNGTFGDLAVQRLQCRTHRRSTPCGWRWHCPRGSNPARCSEVASGLAVPEIQPIILHWIMVPKNRTILFLGYRDMLGRRWPRCLATMLGLTQKKKSRKFVLDGAAFRRSPGREQ
jgi:hypothetical protein